MNNEILTLDDLNPKSEPINKCVVRLITSCWHSARGIHIQKNLTFLRRKCKGFNTLDEDVHNIGAEDVVKSITNLNECKDGIYEVIICNKYFEDYDYKLIPYEDKAV